MNCFLAPFILIAAIACTLADYLEKWEPGNLWRLGFALALMTCIMGGP